MRSTWTAVAALVLVSGMVAQDAPAQPAATPDRRKRFRQSAADKAVADKHNAVPASQAAPIMSSVPRRRARPGMERNDLTATLPVRPDGKISLPLLNDVQAAG